MLGRLAHLKIGEMKFWILGLAIVSLLVFHAKAEPQILCEGEQEASSSGVIIEFSLITKAPMPLYRCKNEKALMASWLHSAYKSIFALPSSEKFCEFNFISENDVANFLGLSLSKTQDLLKNSPAKCLLENFDSDGISTPSPRQWIPVFHRASSYPLDSWTSNYRTLVFLNLDHLIDTGLRDRIVLHELAMSLDALGEISDPENIQELTARFNREGERTGVTTPLSIDQVLFSRHPILADWFAALRSEDFASQILGTEPNTSLQLCSLPATTQLKAHPMYSQISSFQLEENESQLDLTRGIPSFQKILRHESVEHGRKVMGLIEKPEMLITNLKWSMLNTQNGEISVCDFFSRFTPVKNGNTNQRGGPRPSIPGGGS